MSEETNLYTADMLGYIDLMQKALTEELLKPEHAQQKQALMDSDVVTAGMYAPEDEIWREIADRVDKYNCSRLAWYWVCRLAYTKLWEKDDTDG